MRYLLMTALLLSGSLAAFAEGALPKKSDDVLLNRLQVASTLEENLQDGEFSGMDMGVTQKSVGRAVLFSALVPGTGQVYAGSYIKAAAFLAVEATAWALNISFTNKGDKRTTEFEAFADQNWSEQRYWSFVYLRVKDREGVTLPEFQLDTSDPDRPVISDWQSAEPLLDEYDDSRYLPGFTHQLPETKTQQYYEMIGKYPEQFGNAWQDASYDQFYNGYEGRITPMNDLYRDMRADANSFYKTAGWGTMIALANHVISAIDAGFTTRAFNQRQMRLTYENRPVSGEYVSMFGLSVGF